MIGRYNKTGRTDEVVLLKAWTGEPCRINRLMPKTGFTAQPLPDSATMLHSG